LRHLKGTAHTFAICNNELDAELGEFFNPFKYFGLNKISGELKSYNLKVSLSKLKLIITNAKFRQKILTKLNLNPYQKHLNYNPLNMTISLEKTLTF
jgi:hypothetical protein